MFEVRIESREDFYPIYAEFCSQHEFPIIPMIWFPKKCFVSYLAETPTHCIWFYETDSCLAYVGYPASNKFMSSELKKGGLEYLYSKVCEYAKENHYVTVTTYSHPERKTITEALESNNFKIGDKNAINFIKIL
jgi:hypothetical protein